VAQGSASVVVNRSPDVVFAAISDVTRTGEWSPECVACRWVDGATGPALGAKFEGDNKVVVAGLTVKKWTTTSEVTACVPGEVFEFVAEAYTTWRYELEPAGSGTKVTESYSYPSQTGAKGFLYETVMRRSAAMTKRSRRSNSRWSRSNDRAARTRVSGSRSSR
jgi:Polyketide cyclase / dehydrase and lipid transport